MVLTVIIVSYNVKFFLEQCLSSVERAIRVLSDAAEVIVVDNASSDSSVKFLEPNFPNVIFIQNSENVGFAKANNQALKIARGEFILFLNPDTIISEDCFINTIDFFKDHPEAGAVGVKMLEGKGSFLPESKRGFPTAWRSFSRLTGLSRMFPTSKMFAGYNLGHLNADRVHEVEVLAGAFMMVRKEVLDKTGGFDERFFMYAEDIDLSKRIIDAGYKNYYLGNQSIIHFKGESTQKDHKYVNMFYKAMTQYVDKHYENKPGFQKAFLKSGIEIRRILEHLKRSIKG
ncbi:MAG TPA: glycosyltransferase family 2 protein [Chitinophagaceae bacterium]|nr:glycosyltransferase family 2 protein [Chitinophagaceae bacterium]